MQTSSKRSVHVAGVIDLAEAQLLIDCGIKYLGFPLVLDHHREDLAIDAAANISVIKRWITHALLGSMRSSWLYARINFIWACTRHFAVAALRALRGFADGLGLRYWAA
jgi:hypothetical protein